MNSLTLGGKERLTFVSNLATMLTAGIPIMDAIDSMLEDAHGNQRRLLEQLRRDLGDGRTVSDSLARAPKAFDPVTINLIRASEQAGTLDTTLKDMVGNIKKELEFNSNIRGALTYPLFVSVVFVGVILLILAFVIPRIAKVFTSLHVPLPITTKILIWASDTLLNYYPFLIVGAAGLIVLVVVLFQTQRRALANFFLSLPLLRRLGRQIDLARLTRSLGLLLASGIPIVEALELAQHVVVKREVLEVLERARAAVSAGRPLSDGFQGSHHVIPPMMLRMIEAGETSGGLEQAMQELSEYFEEQVAASLKTMTTLMEPVMLVVIGLLVGGMMLSIIAPIYSLIGQVNNGH